MVNSNYLISPETIQADLSRVFKSKIFDLHDIIEWCGIAETRYIKDIDLMVPVYEVPLTVVNSQALLPCNIYRILDVYDGNSTLIDFKFNSHGTYLVNLKYRDRDSAYTEDTIYINYMGTPIDEDTGYPLIIKGHENACEMFCKIRAFEEDAVLGKISYPMWDSWNMKFSGMISNAAQNPYRHKTKVYLKELEIIKGDMFPQIGKLVLSHKKNYRGGSIINPRLNRSAITP